MDDGMDEGGELVRGKIRNEEIPLSWWDVTWESRPMCDEKRTLGVKEEPKALFIRCYMLEISKGFLSCFFFGNAAIVDTDSRQRFCKDTAFDYRTPAARGQAFERDSRARHKCQNTFLSPESTPLTDFPFLGPLSHVAATMLTRSPCSMLTIFFSFPQPV